MGQHKVPTLNVDRSADVKQNINTYIAKKEHELSDKIANVPTDILEKTIKFAKNIGGRFRKSREEEKQDQLKAGVNPELVIQHFGR